MEKINALVRFLNCEEDDLAQNGNTFEYGNQEYLVLTDEEANDATKDYILDSLWAFNSDFILNHSSLDNWSARTEKAISKMQESLCEDANEIVKALIADMDEFISDAIDADGRGHFLAGYDGEENEEDEFYIYRIN